MWSTFCFSVGAAMFKLKKKTMSGQRHGECYLRTKNKERGFVPVWHWNSQFGSFYFLLSAIFTVYAVIHNDNYLTFLCFLRGNWHHQEHLTLTLIPYPFYISLYLEKQVCCVVFIYSKDFTFSWFAAWWMTSQRFAPCPHDLLCFFSFLCIAWRHYSTFLNIFCPIFVFEGVVNGLSFQ